MSIIGKALCTGGMVGMALVGVGACHGGTTATHTHTSARPYPAASTHPAHATTQCKAAAIKVYDRFLATRSALEAIAIADQYNPTGDDDIRLRDVLPECKPVTTGDVDRIAKELQPLRDRAAAHLDTLS